MNDPYKLKDLIYRLPNGEKVLIESREGNTVTVRRVAGSRRMTLAVCRIDRLKRCSAR